MNGNGAFNLEMSIRFKKVALINKAAIQASVKR